MIQPRRKNLMRLFCMIWIMVGCLDAPATAQSSTARDMIRAVHPERAVDILDSLIHRSPKDPSLYLLLGSAYKRTGEMDRAADSFEKAAKFERCDTCHAALDSLGELYEEQLQHDVGRRSLEEDSRKWYEQAMQRGSGFARIRLFALAVGDGARSLTGGSIGSALDLFREAARYNDTLAYYYIRLALELKGADPSRDPAIVDLLKKSPSFDGPKRYDANALSDSSYIARAEGKCDEALAYGEKALSLFPNGGAFLVTVGKCHLCLRDTTGALAWFSNAMQDSLAMAGATVAVARIYEERGQNSAAMKILTQAINKQPKTLMLWDSLAQFYHRQGSPDEFMECSKVSAYLGNLSVRTELKNRRVSYDRFDLSLLPGIASDVDAKLRSTPGGDYIPVQIMPYPIHQAIPKYPIEARQAHMDGNVWVKALVGRTGRVLEARIQKSDDEVFNQPSLEAAVAFRFTPAMMDGEPVAVWASIPFRFHLNR